MPPTKLQTPDWRRVAEMFEIRAQVKGLGEDKEGQDLLAACKTLGIACSGGADSVALLLFAYTQWQPFRAKMRVLHFDHGQRGEASAKDAAFVVELAEALGLDYRTGHAANFSPRGGKKPDEDSLRRARLAFLHANLRQGDCLLLGHQMDDVAETVLMRIARRSGLEGLSAPRARHYYRSSGIWHMRPFLSHRAATIRCWLKESGAIWREDSSNLAPIYERNRLRQEVMPALAKALERDFVSGAALLRERLEATESLLAELLREPIRQLTGDLQSPSRTFPQAAPEVLPHPLVLERALLAWLAAFGLSPAMSPEVQQQLVKALHLRQSGIFNLRKGYRIELVEGIAQLRFPGDNRKQLNSPCLPTPTLLSPGMTLFMPDGSDLGVQREKLSNGLRKAILSGTLDPWEEVYLHTSGADEGQLRVQPASQGERYRPLGAPGSRKVNDALAVRRVPPDMRRELPRFYLDQRLVWVPGLPPADALKIKASTKVALRLTYHPA